MIDEELDGYWRFQCHLYGNNSKVSKGLNASLAIYGNDVVEAALRGLCVFLPYAISEGMAEEA